MTMPKIAPAFYVRWNRHRPWPAPPYIAVPWDQVSMYGRVPELWWTHEWPVRA
jgi:hypothetical protein